MRRRQRGLVSRQRGLVSRQRSLKRSRQRGLVRWRQRGLVSIQRRLVSRQRGLMRRRQRPGEEETERPGEQTERPGEQTERPYEEETERPHAEETVRPGEQTERPGEEETGCCRGPRQSDLLPAWPLGFRQPLSVCTNMHCRFRPVVHPENSPPGVGCRLLYPSVCVCLSLFLPVCQSLSHSLCPSPPPLP